MTRTSMLVLVGFTLLLAGCGTLAAAKGAAPTSGTTIGRPVHRSLQASSASVAPPESGGTVLTTADNGVTVTLAIGQRLTVDLAPEPGAYAWDQPQLIGSSLRMESAAGGYPSRAPVHAVFVAVRAGTSVIASVSDMPCLHARPRCLVAQRVWRISAIVRPNR